MEKAKENRRSHITEKTEKLNEVTKVLKSEFVGIDNIIDELINSVSSWYLFPHIHEKPVVVNLWGLTGVGKTALIKRMVELLDFQDTFYHFDLKGKSGNGRRIESQLEFLGEASFSYPVVIALDEFQHARTIDEGGIEIQTDFETANPIWELLDSGKVPLNRHQFRREHFAHICADLKYLISNGVKVENGVVVEGATLFKRVMTSGDGDTSKKKKKKPGYQYFIPEEMEYLLQKAASDLFAHRIELRKYLNTLNEVETLDFVMQMEKKSNSSFIMDCSNALIFVLGNLDEAYKMSKDFNPDIDADTFHRRSLKITLPDIKEALKKRFRSEQIARLGNNHIIYPAFSKKSFNRIIDLELNKTGEKIYEKEGIKFVFDQSLKDLIYREGVYPTQGTRPIFTTIHKLVHSALGRVLAAYYLHATDANAIRLHSEGGFLKVDYEKVHSGRSKESLYKLSIKHSLNLENLRAQKRDDKQALTAVHESGHAVVCVALTGVVPENIYSQTARPEAAGFVYADLDYSHISQDEFIDRAAIFLAGIAAETLVFGHEKKTNGSSSDIRQATEFIADMVKNEGLGGFTGAFQNPAPSQNYMVYDDRGEVNQTVKRLLDCALEKAELTLKRHMDLLLQVSDYLSEHPFISGDRLRAFVREYAPELRVKNAKDKSTIHPYRSILKQLLSEPRVHEPNYQKVNPLLNKTVKGHFERKGEGVKR